jgi:AraC-like DNA-binding protein
MLDPLSHILALAHVDAAFFSRMRGASPWAVQTRGATGGIFHVIVRGSASILVDGRTIHVGQGHVLVIPAGLPHVLCNPPEAPPVWIGALPKEEGPLTTVVAGEGPADCEVLCGTLRLGPLGQELLLRHLPPVLHASGPELSAWVAALSGELASRPPGADAVSACLGELLFLLTLREWLGRVQSPSLLAASVHPEVGRAVAGVLAEPAADWQLDRLARRAGLSRTVFCERFVAIMGESPAAWVTRWRMIVAREQLAAKGVSIASVAEAVGYQDEAAFQRAFRRVVGVPPAKWRKAQAEGAVP